MLVFRGHGLGVQLGKAITVPSWKRSRTKARAMRGLGTEYVPVTIPTKAGGGAATEPTQTTWSPEYGGGRGLKQHDSRQIRAEIDALSMYGLSREGMIEAIKTAAATLPPCTTAMPMLSIGRDFWPLWTSPQIDGRVGIMAPMTFERYGVVFSPSNLQNDRLTRVFVPNEHQRRAIELQVIKDSYPLIFEGRSWEGGLGKAVPDVDWAAKEIESRGGAFFLNNFERNPIQPTAAEYNEKGGLKSWMMRGGYPLSLELIHAKKRLVGEDILGKSIQFCPTTPCRDGDGFPNCQLVSLKDFGRWSEYVAIPQGPGAQNFELTFVYHEPGKFQKLANWWEGVFTDFLKLFCATQPYIAPQVNSLVAEKCAKRGVTREGFTGDIHTLPTCPETKDGWCRTMDGFPQRTQISACNRGESGCVCEAPPAAAQASVSIINYAAGEFCAGLARDQTPTVPPPMDPPPEIPTPDASWRPPLWAIVLGGLAAGGVLFSMRR